jgi:uncharacterized DUF497 family protein
LILIAYCPLRSPANASRRLPGRRPQVAEIVGSVEVTRFPANHLDQIADAIAALEDTKRVEEIDTRFVYDEERIQVIGMAQGKVLFVIVTVPGEDTCRIISARKATPHEQDRYYAGNLEAW